MLINQCLGRYKNISDNKNPIEFDGELVADHEKIANNMNEFYITMGHYMSKQLPDPINNSDYYLHKSKQPLDEITTNEISETELYRLVLKLPNKSSLGPDGLSNKILKAIIKIPLVLKNLTKCINKSINESIFPNCLKTAKITPIFKSGDKTVASNYRPIAQLVL